MDQTEIERINNSYSFVVAKAYANISPTLSNYFFRKFVIQRDPSEATVFKEACQSCKSLKIPGVNEKTRVVPLSKRKKRGANLSKILTHCFVCGNTNMDLLDKAFFNKQKAKIKEETTMKHVKRKTEKQKNEVKNPQQNNVPKSIQTEPQSMNNNIVSNKNIEKNNPSRPNEIQHKKTQNIANDKNNQSPLQNKQKLQQQNQARNQPKKRDFSNVSQPSVENNPIVPLSQGNKKPKKMSIQEMLEEKKKRESSTNLFEMKLF